MLAGALLMTVPLLAASVPPSDTLDADIVDTSAFPSVVIDVVVPPPLRSVTVTPDMVQLTGGTIESVAPVDPAGIAVGLVIDDGPTVPADIVQDAQGASVELVRNVGEGTQIALSTPSGLQSTLTSDRRANIARIAGITAGAPDVVPLSGLILARGDTGGSQHADGPPPRPRTRLDTHRRPRCARSRARERQHRAPHRRTRRGRPHRPRRARRGVRRRRPDRAGAGGGNRRGDRGDCPTPAHPSDSRRARVRGSWPWSSTEPATPPRSTSSRRRHSRRSSHRPRPSCAPTTTAAPAPAPAGGAADNRGRRGGRIGRHASRRRCTRRTGARRRRSLDVAAPPRRRGRTARRRTRADDPSRRA